MTDDWLTGFIEGEGCFAWIPSKIGVKHGKPCFRAGFPAFALVQKNREILDLIKDFLEKNHGIRGKVSEKAGNGKVYFQYSIGKIADMRKLYTLLHPRMCHPGKKFQLETKWEKIFELRKFEKKGIPLS